MKVQVVYTGRGYDQGAKLPGELALDEGSSVSDALKALQQAAPDVTLPESCLVSVAGTHLGTLAKHDARDLRDGDEIVLIAPVAGG